MKIRDLTEAAIQSLQKQSKAEFEEWFERTAALEFGTRRAMQPREIWQLAFSQGVCAVLSRVDFLQRE